MRKEKIITGQKVTLEKREMARELRCNMTPAERVLWEQLRANRLDDRHFRRQQIIDGFIVDFYCHQAGLIIEVDGPIHETQQEADAEREAILNGRGLTILRFTNQQVMNDLNQVLREIRGYLGVVNPPPSPLPTREGDPGSSLAEDRESDIPPPHVGKEPEESDSPDADDQGSSDSPPHFGEGLGEGS